MTDYALLASAPDKNNITKMIRQFYGGTEVKVLDCGMIERLSDGKILTGVIVRTLKGRYRFEQINL